MNDPIACLEKTDKYTMYFYQAKQQPDKEGFLCFIVNKLNCHFKKKYWDFITKEQVTKGDPIMDAVWNMKHKRNIKTSNV